MVFVTSWFILFMLVALLLVGGVVALVLLVLRSSDGGPPPAPAEGLPTQHQRRSNLQQRGERYQEERERILSMVEKGTISSEEADKLFHSLERETTATACPICGGEIRAEALKCRHCKNWLVDEYIRPHRLCKSRNRMVAGVCGGIAEYYDVDPTLVRLLAVVLLLISAILTGLIAYLIAALIIPDPE